ncbi:caspase family protein [Streptomyces sp. NPDC004237]|uniref:caspase, EACC1-associated type n=1 Tax=Streptomyces sp. NPDC004237 TaxID=3154455 RepID=UPI0033AA6093
MARLPDPAGSHAVLFGTASYDELPDLPAVGNNLKDLHAVLTGSLGGFTEEHSAVVLDPSEARHVYNPLRHHALQATDTLLVYFAGHGMRKVGGGLHLAVTTSQESSMRVSTFDYDELRALVNDSDAKNKIVILDCCYSGRAIQAMSATSMAEQLDIDGACVLTSAAKDKEALAPPGAEHTTFTGELLYLLRHGVPGAGQLLSLGTIAEQLRRNARLRNLPIPTQMFEGTTRHLALTRNPAAPVTHGPPAPSTPPPPRPSARQAYVSRGLVFVGTSHATTKDLARTVRENWSTAAERYFRQMGTAAHPTESWGELRSWLRQFNDSRTDDVEGRSILIDRYLTDPALSPDHKVLHLLRWLDPDGPVVYRGRPVTYAGLVGAGLRRYVGAETNAELIGELSAQHGLLDILAEFTALDRLRGVQEAWARAVTAWQQKTRDESWPPEVRNWAAVVGPGALLAALLPPEHLEEVRPGWQAGETTPPDPTTAWYSRLQLAAGGRDTLLGRLIEAKWSEQARREGLIAEGNRKLAAREATERRHKQQQEAMERREQRQADDRARRERQQRAKEEQREQLLREEQHRQRDLEWQAATVGWLSPAGRALGVLRALALGFGWTLLPLLLIWLSWWFSSYEFDAALFLSCQVVILTGSVLGSLVPCAARLGGMFRPRLRVPSSWLPWSLSALVAGAVMLLYGLIGKDTVLLRSSELSADSDLLRQVGLSAFLKYAYRDGYAVSGWGTFVSLLGVLAFVGCFFCGLNAGNATARNWEKLATRAEQDSRRAAELP